MMWSPTHVEVTVQSARGLITKGKNGTNDAFVIIALGKEKFQTSVKKKSKGTLEWHEKCELAIPKQGNEAEVILTVLHRNGLKDHFLGLLVLPLAEMDVYDRPKNKWYKLHEKPGKNKARDLGEIEIKIIFRVKAGSLTDLSKKEKHKSSIGQLSQAAQSFGNISGSLISLGSLEKRKGLKKLATKIKKLRKNKGEEPPLENELEVSQQTPGDADPGVISGEDTDDDFTLDELSQKGSNYSVGVSTPSTRSIENVMPQVAIQDTTPPSPPSKPPRSTFSNIMTSENANEHKKHNMALIKSSSFKGSYETIMTANTIQPSTTGFSNESSRNLAGKSREDLIEMVVSLQKEVELQRKHQRDLEDYIDRLLLRVMETSPKILQNPYVGYDNQLHFL